MSRPSSDRPLRTPGLARAAPSSSAERRPGTPRATKEASWQVFLPKLLVRPVRQPGESLMGHALRVAFDNGVTRPPLLFRVCSLKDGAYSRLCPVCLREDNCLWRAEWSESGAAWCPRHRTWLVDRCSACKQRYRWNTLTFDRCACGESLGDAKVVPVQASIASRQSLSAEPSELLLWLGEFARFGLQGSAHSKARSTDMRELRETLLHGSEMLQDWPSTFLRCLGSKRQLPEVGTGPQRVNHAWPGLLGLVAAVRTSDARRPLLHAIGQYVDASQTTEYPLFSKNPTIQKSAVSLTRVGKQLGVAKGRLMRAVAHVLPGKVVARQTRSGRIVGGLSPEFSNKVQVYLADRISPSEAGRVLSLSLQRVRQLCDAKTLDSIDGTVSRLACRTIGERILESASTPASGETISVRVAFKMYYPVAATSEFFDAVLGGALRVYGPKGADLRIANLHVDRSAIVALRQKVADVSLGAISVREAAKILRVKHEVARHFVAIGLLKATKYHVGGRRGSTSMVSREAVDLFEKTYARLADLARQAGVASPKGFTAWAAENGLKLVCGPGVDGCRQYIVARSQVRKVSATRSS